MSTDFGTAYQEDVAYKAALERAEMLQGYYTHLLVYVVVNTGLFFIDLFTRGNDGGWWFYWPLLGWGDRPDDPHDGGVRRRLLRGLEAAEGRRDLPARAALVAARQRR
jgi:hypothetical protein